MLRVDALTVRFGGVRAVDNVSFELAEGERLAVLGSSGCGKSTLLRAIAGLETGDGTVSVDGTDLTHAAPDLRPIGLMFQDHALFPHRTVEQNVAFGLRMAGEADRARTRRVREMLALVGLDGFGGREIATLSGGEAQRVALARALAPAPKVLLLDEPLGALDPLIRAELQADLKEIFRTLGKTVVLVTHDMGEAGHLGDVIVLMRAGEVIQSGTLRDLVESPADEFVRRFISAQRGTAEILGLSP